MCRTCLHYRTKALKSEKAKLSKPIKATVIIVFNIKLLETLEAKP
jgi:hypothetical protein